MIFYSLKSRVIVWRAITCLRPCDRPSSPLSVIFSHLRTRANETSNGFYYSLHAEVQSNSAESYKVSDAL